MFIRAHASLNIVLASWVAVGCQSRAEGGGVGAPDREHEASIMKLTSAAFTEGQAIPRRFTCEGDDVSPPLTWSEVPAGTRSLALVVEDPDAPDPAAPKRVWVHWVLYDLPPSAGGLAEAVSAATLPAGAREGQNDWGRAGYGGPCPPIGRHRYFHRLYALDVALGERGALSRAELDAAMQGHVLATAALVGTYAKAGAGG